MNEDGLGLVWSTAHWGDAESTLPELDNALMKLLLENIATRVAVVGLDRCYTYANRETLRFMGLPAERVIGHHMSEVLDAGVYNNLIPLLIGLSLVVLLVIIGRVPVRYNVRNLSVRWRTTLMTGLAFTLVIALMTGILAFVNGMFRLTEQSGQPGNVMRMSG